MTLSRIGWASMALVVSVAMGLGMTSCGGGTIGFLWVLGTQYNQIGGFKIDDYTGNLTGTVGSPYPSGGTNPIMLALKSGGRYLYVLNAGNATTPGNFSLFSVGGDGILAYQQSYTPPGTNPVWIATDTTGGFLYVLVQQSPNYAVSGVGAIIVYSIDANTGRPSLITNDQVKNAQGTNVPYFEVGLNPIEFRNTASCLYALDAGDQTIFPYTISGSGQLTQPTNSSIALSTSNATSVNVGGTGYVYVTDAGATPGGTGSIRAYSQAASCSLAPVNGSSVTLNISPASNPIQTASSPDGKYLFVINQSTPNTAYANSSISAFLVESNGQLEVPPPASNTPNPSPVGSGPVCIAFDPTNQYVYTSNSISNSLTGYRYVPQYGSLQPLTRGSNFPTVGLPSCFVISGTTGF